MTREEAMELIKEAYGNSEMTDEIIKALGQETCEDCISRQASVNAIANTCFWLSADDWKDLMECISSLPPVTPTQDTRQVARWVNNIHDLPICSKCGNYVVFDHAIDDYYYSDYCPKCGARMENAVEKIYKESEEE